LKKRADTCLDIELLVVRGNEEQQPRDFLSPAARMECATAAPDNQTKNFGKDR